MIRVLILASLSFGLFCLYELACFYAIIFTDVLTKGVQQTLGTTAGVLFAVSYVAALICAVLAPSIFVVKRFS